MGGDEFVLVCAFCARYKRGLSAPGLRTGLCDHGQVWNEHSPPAQASLCAKFVVDKTLYGFRRKYSKTRCKFALA